MAAPRAIILGCAGPALSAAERAFFAEADPWGFILFARNVADSAQLSALTADLRAAVGRDAPIFIDQEGGRVARLRAPHWREWPWPPRMEMLGAEAMDEALALRFRLIAHELRAVGIDGNCMPIADVAFPRTDAIIADRALGRDAGTVARRAGLIADALLAGGVLPVIKHLPGHGRADMDSHLALPVVDASLADLRATDFAAFRPLAGQALGMTAHVVYTALDADAPATLSPAGIRAIREDIGFDGCLMTDDLSMGALSGTMRSRAEAAIAAGCDLILHCNGDRAEMDGALEGTPRLAGRVEARAAAALAARRAPQPFDVAAADARHAALVAPLAEGCDA
ncbi:MAG: glycoside hydrolase family 3 N-terminal domain-containing protein [Pseudomonadota bacterium]|nr:glycoside hydrolase family 3 N-terminal domain-containing protein [Pseudomonadota bacterium]